MSVVNRRDLDSYFLDVASDSDSQLRPNPDTGIPPRGADEHVVSSLNQRVFLLLTPRSN